MDIHVSNLALLTTEEDLRKAFAAHGSVASVSILTEDRHFGLKTGASMGFGFVSMPDNGQARAALAALDRHEMRGNAMSVKEARPRRISRHRR
jgi:RNA recognition motif-containing protein